LFTLDEELYSLNRKEEDIVRLSDDKRKYILYLAEEVTAG
jgi:hypothetical protein